MIDVNYLAILACGVAALAISFVWYGPLFGKQWMKMTGVDQLPPEAMEKGKKDMPKNSAIQFVLAVVMAFILSHVLVFSQAYLGTVGIISGINTGFAMWLGFVAPVTIGAVLWEGRSWKLWGIVAGGWLIVLLAMGTILSLWV